MNLLVEKEAIQTTILLQAKCNSTNIEGGFLERGCTFRQVIGRGSWGLGGCILKNRGGYEVI